MTTIPPDRTTELRFASIDEGAVETLLNNRVLILGDTLGSTELKGIETAYIASRRHDLLHRMAGRALLEAGFGKTDLYKRLRVSDIKLDLENPAQHMIAAMPAIDTIRELNAQFFEYQALLDIYGNSELNLALFGLSRTKDAFGEHQDSRGATGLAYAAQFKPTKWQIHKLTPSNPHPPAPLDFTFTTETGDIVVLMQREGACPPSIPYRESGSHFYEDASLIHSGVNLSWDPRYIMGVFNQQVAETLQ